MNHASYYDAGDFDFGVAMHGAAAGRTGKSKTEREAKAADSVVCRCHRLPNAAETSL
jgi:hypothetical protein